MEYTTTTLTMSATGVASGGAYPSYQSSFSGNLMTTSTGGLRTADIFSLDAAEDLSFYTALPTPTAFSSASFYYIDEFEKSDVKFIITTDSDGATFTATSATDAEFAAS